MQNNLTTFNFESAVTHGLSCISDTRTLRIRHFRSDASKEPNARSAKLVVLHDAKLLEPLCFISSATLNRKDQIFDCIKNARVLHFDFFRLAKSISCDEFIFN